MGEISTLSDPFIGKTVEFHSTPYSSRKTLHQKQQKPEELLSSSPEHTNKKLFEETGYETMSDFIDSQPTRYELIRKVYEEIESSDSWSNIEDVNDSSHKIPKLIIEIILEEDTITQTSRMLEENLAKFEGYDCAKIAENERTLLVAGKYFPSNLFFVLSPHHG